MKFNIFIIILIAVFMTAYSSIYIITEGEQVLITEFGQPIGDPIQTAGVHFKKPFVQDVRYLDKRILTWDGDPNQITTKDKKIIGIDTTARWKIVDPLKFIQNLRNITAARENLDSILDGITRDVISGHNLVEAVRNSNDILDRPEEPKKIKGEVEEEITGEIQRVLIGREKLSKIITKLADEKMTKFGINVVDVQLKKISYEKSVERKVYERMISERQRIAEKIKSIGKGEKAKIEGRLNRDLEEIQSAAYKQSQIIRGQADAKAILIYANTLSKDPQFYEFTKTLDSYRKAIKSSTELILSSDSEFLKYLKGM